MYLSSDQDSVERNTTCRLVHRLPLTLPKEQGMFLVLDTDALYMVRCHLELIKRHRHAVLTHNINILGIPVWA